ncbi:hypothetical protein I302_100911 [Kwoniella bestiolae CBS 10118]|uniref:Uncharacterized protein n=1 Tax=Kwoniella bestiolae CBS 10118 TaxID=1296100 RepID=A0A1B9G6H4_9TREE|nr:hypothetical protein I302_04287 [Kwoniella bestiolae CBS 10118]OCF26601.1 hypothetical protein I302_04287 [Kwoniella bestiolae CBS 10118]
MQSTDPPAPYPQLYGEGTIHLGCRGSNYQPTNHSVILWCPKARRKDRPRVFGLSRSDVRTNMVHSLTEAIERKLNEICSESKAGKPWYMCNKVVTSVDLAEAMKSSLPSVVQDTARNYTYDGFKKDQISIQEIPNDKFDSFIKFRRNLWPKGIKGILALPEKSRSTINDEISEGGKLCTYGIINPKTMKSEADRNSTLMLLSKFAKDTEERIGRKPLSMALNLENRLIDRASEFSNLGYVIMNKDEIESFRSIMDPLPDVPSQTQAESGDSTGSTHGHVVEVSSPAVIENCSGSSHSTQASLDQRQSGQIESEIDDEQVSLM